MKTYIVTYSKQYQADSKEEALEQLKEAINQDKDLSNFWVKEVHI
jgi:hypothetical protein